MQTKIILETPPPVPTKAEIVAVLDKHKIPLQQWGIGTARSLDHLVEYMTRDRLHFHRNGSPHLTIDVHAVVVIITFCHRKGWLELYEDRQVFPSGKVLKRDNFNGIAETMRRNGTLREEAMRCLAEELCFRDPSASTLSECLLVQHRGPIDSEKWPGLKALYHRYLFQCTIARRLYKPKGYVEIDGDIRIHFKWRPRGQAQLKLV